SKTLIAELMTPPLATMTVPDTDGAVGGTGSPSGSTRLPITIPFERQVEPAPDTETRLVMLSVPVLAFPPTALATLAQSVSKVAPFNIDTVAVEWPPGVPNPLSDTIAPPIRVLWK